jgi:hypothetical protein
MKIQFHSLSPARDIQQQFSSFFPFLKLEFVKKKHAPDQPSPAHLIWPPSTRQDVMGLKNAAESFAFSDQWTVRDFEQYLTSAYGLFAQVFRKNAHTWVETTRTDEWTLKRQNEYGRELSQPEKKENKYETEYDPDAAS